MFIESCGIVRNGMAQRQTQALNTSTTTEKQSADISVTPQKQQGVAQKQELSAFECLKHAHAHTGKGKGTCTGTGTQTDRDTGAQAHVNANAQISAGIRKVGFDYTVSLTSSRKIRISKLI